MTVISAADPLAGVCAYLDSTIGTLVTTTPPGLTQVPAGVPAIFRPDLPRGFDQLMPVACIVVRHAGGTDLFGQSYIRLQSPRIDIACYGETAQEAARVAAAAVIALKRLTPSVWANCQLRAANISSNPLPSFELNTLWALSLFSVQLIHAEDTVSP